VKTKPLCPKEGKNLEEKRIYETLFIISPNLEDEKRDEMAEKIKSFIEERVEGNVQNLERWGKRKLAYKVRKGFSEGDYTLILFEADPEKVIDLEKYYKIVPEIFRWQTFRREDLEKAKSKKEEKNEKTVEEEPKDEQIIEEKIAEEKINEVIDNKQNPVENESVEKETKTEE
jgi:small subunit ribosomal protein S6